METFIQWALDPARCNEEKYTVELLIESGVRLWNARNNTGIFEDQAVREERQRQRKLNPAYIATYTEAQLRQAAEVLPEIKKWHHIPYSDRPIRDLKAFQFLELESLELNSCEAVDLSPIANIPSLQSFTFSSPECSDFRVLSECKNLRHLNLTFTVPWPEVSGLELLQDLAELHLAGNLLAFAPGTIWAKVRRGWLSCSPLAARNCRDLPSLPACRFLVLGGVDRLDGIEKMPHLKNLVLNGPVRDYAPLGALQELTCLTVTGDKPRSVQPLVHLPRLQYAQFGDKFLANTPRDYAPLAEAPMLRELVVLGCPPVEMEVAAINAGLIHWDDLIFSPELRPVPPLNMIVSEESGFAASKPADSADSEDREEIDLGLRACEGHWVGEHLQEELNQLTGNPFWGSVSVNGENLTFYIEIYAIETAEMFPEVIQSVRKFLARLRQEFTGILTISLRNPRSKSTPAELEREEQLRELQDNAEFDQWQRDQEEYLDRLHRYELKKQEGSPIDPAEFSVPEPSSAWNDDEEDDSDEGQEFLMEEGDEELEEEETDELLEDEHPLADHYRLMAHLTLREIRFHPKQRGIAVHLMRREPDLG